jgi:hypothetical protein
MTQSEIIALKNSRINTPVYRKKSPIIKTRKNNPLVKASVEMSMIFNNYTHLTRHRIGSKIHKNVEKVIRGLKNGIVTEFGDYINVIIEKGSNQKLKRSEIILACQKKYTLKERKEIYQKLNDLLSPEYHPKNKKKLPRNLWDALSHSDNYSNVSWLMYVILRDIKPLEKSAIVDMDYEVDLILRRWSKTRLQNSVPELKNILSKLNKYYFEEFLVPYYNCDTVIGGQWGTWDKYLNGMLEFFDEKYSGVDKNPGWFRPGSKPIKAWEREMLRFQDEINKYQSYTTAPEAEYQCA